MRVVGGGDGILGEEIGAIPGEATVEDHGLSEQEDSEEAVPKAAVLDDVEAAVTL